MFETEHPLVRQKLYGPILSRFFTWFPDPVKRAKGGPFALPGRSLKKPTISVQKGSSEVLIRMTSNYSRKREKSNS